MILAIRKCIALDIVITKGILLMYIISMTIMTSLYTFNNPSGKLSHMLSITLDEVLQVVFPFRDPKFGPSMSSACIMSSFVIQQFSNRSLSM